LSSSKRKTELQQELLIMISPKFPSVIGAPSLPFGAPMQGNHYSGSHNAAVIDNSALPQGMSRSVSYAADHQGCGFWRLHWPIYY
jgi:hypothetical protein